MTLLGAQLFNIKPNQDGYLAIGIRDHYRAYKFSDRQHNLVEFTLYREVLKFLFIKLWHYIFKESWIFRAPENFGEFYVKQSLVSSGFHKDWQKTKEKNKLIKKYNLHTSGKSFFITWNKTLSKVKNKTRYKFMPYRGCKEEMAGSRGLAAWIKQCSEDPNLPDFKAHYI